HTASWCADGVIGLAVPFVLYSLSFFFLRSPLVPPSTLFPYTTLFRSHHRVRVLREQVLDRLLDGDDPKPPRLVDQVDHYRQRRRSEEHTSELQSHLNIVCRLLLEKKNHNTIHFHHILHNNENIENRIT